MRIKRHNESATMTTCRMNPLHVVFLYTQAWRGDTKKIVLVKLWVLKDNSVIPFFVILWKRVINLIILSLIINISFSSLFLLSIVGKLTNLKDTRLMVLSYGVLPQRFAYAAVTLLLVAECALLLLFVADEWKLARDIAAIGTLFIFSIAIVNKRKSNNRDSAGCACIGSVDTLNKYPLTRNALLIVILLADSMMLTPVSWSPAAMALCSLLIACLLQLPSTYRTYRGMSNHVIH